LAGGQTTVKLKYRPVIVGYEQVHLNLVDTDTRELVRDVPFSARFPVILAC
jgi:hypothetical protein